MLRRFISNVLSGRPSLDTEEFVPSRRRVLNVGGGNKRIAIPDYYEGWEHVLLDIAPGPDVDVVGDARMLSDHPAQQYDAIYCSHNLEHYFRHDCVKVLDGFAHVLKPSGFADIRVPDIDSVFRAYVERGIDIDDVLYQSPGGPISAHDVVYGWGLEIERSGVDFYAHKRGFTVQSLQLALVAAGFMSFIKASREHFELQALAFKEQPTEAQAALFGLSPPTAA